MAAPPRPQGARTLPGASGRALDIEAGEAKVAEDEPPAADHVAHARAEVSIEDVPEPVRALERRPRHVVEDDHVRGPAARERPERARAEERLGHSRRALERRRRL